LADGTNLYRRAGNDPVNFTDPRGLYQAGNPRASAFVLIEPADVRLAPTWITSDR